MAWRHLVIWSVVMTLFCSYSECHAVTRVHVRFMMKGRHFVQEFRSLSILEAPTWIKPECSTPTCPTQYRQEQRIREGKKEKAKKQEYEMGGKKYIFLHIWCNSEDIYFFVVLCLWLLGSWAEGREGVLKSSPLFLAQKRVWAWKADCCKPLNTGCGAVLSQGPHHDLACSWLRCWAGVTSRFQQWCLLHLRTTMFLHLV